MAKHETRWRSIANDYFTFSRSQRRAIIILLIAIVLVGILPPTFHFFFSQTAVKVDSVTVQQVSALKAEQPDYGSNYQKEKAGADYADYREPEKRKYDQKDWELFPFDPNTASETVWKRLGIRDKTIATIQKYLSKGGHFYKSEDLKKIYGLHEEEVNRLMPYVRIAGKDNPGWKNAEASESRPGFTKPATLPKIVDVNTADTTAFIALPGIGSKLAARIVNYREKLGGFYSISQVGETYGLPDSTFQKIKPRLTVSGTVRKININTATAADMKMPYMPYNVVNAIIQQRIYKGPFKTVEDIKNIPLIDEPLFVRIAPYLTVE